MLVAMLLACTHRSCACAGPTDITQPCEATLHAVDADEWKQPNPPPSLAVIAVAEAERILKVRRPGTTHADVQLLGKYWRARANRTNVTSIVIDEWPTESKANRWSALRKTCARQCV